MWPRWSAPAPGRSPRRRKPVGKVYRIGLLGAHSPADQGKSVEALRARLRDLGYVEGKNVVMEYRWAEGKLEAERAGVEMAASSDVLKKILAEDGA